MNLNQVDFVLEWQDKFPEDIVKNTVTFLNIARKYKVNEVGIGMWDRRFKSSRSVLSAFYKKDLEMYDTNAFSSIIIKDNCFAEGTYYEIIQNKKKTTKIWHGQNIWCICDDFDNETNKKFCNGCGNAGQYQFKTDQLIHGIWAYSDETGWIREIPRRPKQKD